MPDARMESLSSSRPGLALIEIYERSSRNEIKALILNLLTGASQTSIPALIAESGEWTPTRGCRT